MKLILSFSIITGLATYALAIIFNNFTGQGSLIAAGAAALGSLSVFSIFYLLFKDASQKTAIGITTGLLTGILLYFALLEILDTVYISAVYEPYVKTLSFLVLVFLGTSLGYIKTSDLYSNSKKLSNKH